MKSSKVVFVSPVPRVPTQGRDKQTFTLIDPRSGEMKTGQNMNKTKETGAASEYSFPFNPRTNRLETGLEVTVPNPIYQLSVEEVMESYSLSHQWREQIEKLVNQKEIKKQTLYEIIDDVAPGYYTSEIAGGYTIFNTSKSTRVGDLKPNFLQRFKIILYDYPNRFEDDGTKSTSRERLAIELVKVCPRIAASKRDMNTVQHHFYISEENEAEVEKVRKQDVIDEAVYLKVKLQKESNDYKNYQVGSLLTHKNNKPLIEGSISPSKVKRDVTAYLGEGSSQMENVEKFMKVMQLLDSKEGREKFEMMYLVQQAVNTGVITIRDGYYIWNSKAGTPNMHKHINYDKFISLLQSEKKGYDPKDTVTTNWYADLFNEVKDKGALIE